MSVRLRPESCSRGFTLIEALVALSVIAAMLAAIGGAVATTVRSARAIDGRLALAGTAQTLLATLPPREALQVGRTSGQRLGITWRIDVVPMPLRETARWTAVAVDIRLQNAGGGRIDLKTVRLVAR